MKPWTAEITLSDSGARQLIFASLPQLRGGVIRLLAQGWDSYAYEVKQPGRVTIVRIPRRQEGAQCLRNELVHLPLLAPHLPLPVSHSTLCAEPSATFKWPIGAYEKLAGTPADEAAKSPRFRAKSALGLGRFLRALHGIPTNIGQPLGDHIGRMDLPRRRAVVRERTRRCEAQTPQIPWADVEAALDALAMTPPDDQAGCWVHGDLYCRHLLVDPEGGLVGVIDFGDLHVGDVAVDLSCVATWMPQSAQEEFFRVYGTVLDTVWQRAIFRGIYHAICLLDYALDIDDKQLTDACLLELRGGLASWRALG